MPKTLKDNIKKVAAIPLQTRITSTWAASKAYSLGDFVVPSTVNGYIYECTTAGTSGTAEPTWPTTAGTTVTDNTAVWTCRSPNLVGSAIDTKLSEMYSFDTALVDIVTGKLGTQAATKVKIEEADISDFSAGVQTAEGGEEITVAADSVYKMEIARKKRYLRAYVTIDASSGLPKHEVFIGMTLCNWAKPFPIL